MTNYAMNLWRPGGSGSVDANSGLDDMGKLASITCARQATRCFVWPDTTSLDAGFYIHACAMLLKFTGPAPLCEDPP